MLNFLPGYGVFALAGLIAAAGPVVIHLLNRRRFRVVNWAAMDFLLEALQRNRRMLHLRDLLLLALRTACVLLFGLARARPFFSETAATTNANEPLHAVLVMDNSLSMGYRKLDRSLLDEARAEAKDFIDELPLGSRISVLPLCGSASSFSLDAYRTKEDARDALDKIEVVDRTGSAAQAADLARQAIAQVPDMPAKRVAFIGDQQLIDWPAESLSDQLKDLPEMQVVSVAPPEHENTWIADFSIMDGVADVETPAVFSATVMHEGQGPRSNVQVTLSVDGTEVGSETIDLDPGQAREVTFKYRFDAAVEPGKAVFVPAKVSIPPDHLETDDFRVLAVPVVAALPVVFVDQYGADEDRKRNRYGETIHLRRLLAPVTSRSDSTRQLVEIRHLKIDQLDRDTLKDVRLVVIAGIANPEGSVPLLRDYVRQGGQLVIAAGADFDPAQWNAAAWLDGSGILPVPLKAQPIGKTPEETTGELKPFFLAPKTMLSHDIFQLAGSSPEELKDLYSKPLFFKAVDTDVSDATLASEVTSEQKHIEADRNFLTEARARLTKWSEKEGRGLLSEEDRASRNEVSDRLASVQPDWLTWAEREAIATDIKPEALAERTRPRVLAQFDNDAPFLVERSLGRGRVVLVTSGVYSNWNTLPRDHAVLLYDRLLRSMLGRTLPVRNFDQAEQVTIPVVDRNGMYTLERPGSSQSEVMQVDALGADVYGVTVNNLTARGIYTVTALKGDISADPDSAPAKLWEVKLAVNGSPRESELATIDAVTLKDRMGEANYRWVSPGEAISLEGAQVRFQDLWKWLLLLMLLGMLAEMAILARPMLARERAK